MQFFTLPATVLCKLNKTTQIMFSKFFRYSVFSTVMVACLASSWAAAQAIPQLGGPVSLSGAPTTAQFAAGVKAGSGGFGSAFDLNSSPELIASVSPQANHIGSAGKLYVLAIVGNVQFSLLGDGSWQLFDGTVAGLGGAQSLAGLASANEIAISNIGELFSKPGVVLDNGVANYSIFVAYDTSASPGELYFSSVPLQFTIRNSALLKTTSLPELAAPAKLTGGATTAKFFGGASVRGSNAFPGTLQGSDDLSVQLEILPEIGHVGAAGNGYVLAIVGGVQFALAANGSWQLFDGTVAGLGLAASYSALASSQVLTADSVISLIDSSGVAATNGSVQFLVFAAYDTTAQPGELFYSSSPAVFNVVKQQTVSALEIYQTSIEQQVVQSRCVLCHVSPGVAQESGLIYQRASATSAAANFSVLEAFVAKTANAKSYILGKASGSISHDGGALLSTSSTDYANFSAFLDALIAAAK